MSTPLRMIGRSVTKIFGATLALADVDFEFDAGTVHTLEGPNGSGKSTLLRIVAGLIRPTDGTVTFEGTNTGGVPSIGFVSHASMLYPDLTGLENVWLFARLHGVQERDRVERFLNAFDLGDAQHRPVRTYSRGQLQRAALARSLVHAPSVLLLDEPSTGLDDAGRALLEDTVRRERERGTLLVAVTHDAAFADRVADRRIQLRDGRLV